MQPRTLCLALFVSLALASTARAQEVTNLPAGTDQAVGIEAGLDSAFVARASYAHRVPDFLRDAMVYARFTWPFAGPDAADFAFDAGVRATVVGTETWKAQLLVGPLVRNTSNELFSGTAVGLRSAMLAGYRSDGWGLMGELGYEQILATHVRHSDRYRKIGYAEAKDGWYAITGGTWQLGLRGGGRIGRVEINGAAGVMASDQLKSTVPPFYATLGAAYAF